MYELPTNASLWQVLLADEEGFVTSVEQALEEYGPESHVEVSIRRLSALPTYQAADRLWSLAGRPEDEADIAVEWKLDMVDDIGETDHIEAQLRMAQAMAAGLNGALANQGDWNRSTELAAALHTLADKIASFAGALPHRSNLYVYLGGTHTRANETAVANVDALALALTGQPGKPVRSVSGSWEHKASVKQGPLNTEIYAYIPAPDEENPAALKARIAELEAQLVGGAL